MTNSLKMLAATLVVASMSVIPAQATTWQAQPGQPQAAQLQNVQFEIRRGDSDRRDRGDRFERRGNFYYYNGHRGSRERRSGWRHYNGWWFPQSAFSFSINIDADRGRGWDRDRGPGYGRLTRAHIDWCYSNYRSYRASDNTFQPYNGPRRQCVSPYSR